MILMLKQKISWKESFRYESEMKLQDDVIAIKLPIKKTEKTGKMY